MPYIPKIGHIGDAAYDRREAEKESALASAASFDRFAELSRREIRSLALWRQVPRYPMPDDFEYLPPIARVEWEDARDDYLATKAKKIADILKQEGF